MPSDSEKSDTRSRSEASEDPDDQSEAADAKDQEKGDEDFELKKKKRKPAKVFQQKGKLTDKRSAEPAVPAGTLAVPLADDDLAARNLAQRPCGDIKFQGICQ